MQVDQPNLKWYQNLGEYNGLVYKIVGGHRLEHAKPNGSISTNNPHSIQLLWMEGMGGDFLAEKKIIQNHYGDWY